jgi:hypothetical protein
MLKEVVREVAKHNLAEVSLNTKKIKGESTRVPE